MLVFTPAQGSAGGMADLLNMLLLAMLLFVGFYGLYTMIRLRKTYMLFPNRFLYPNGCTPETCLDEGGFIDYILPRLTILSISALLLSIAFALWLFVFPHVQNLVLDLLTLFLPAGLLFWYAVIQHKSYKLFW